VFFLVERGCLFLLWHKKDVAGHFEDESILLLCKEVSRINLIHEISALRPQCKKWGRISIFDISME